MGKITFVSWLIKQAKRKDAVGDLASDLIGSGLYDDPQFTYDELLRLAKERDVDLYVLESLEIAHAEWGMLF